MSNHIVTQKNHLLLSGNGKNKQLKNQTTALQKMPTNNKVAIIKENKKIETNITPTNPYQIIVEKMPESVVITSQEGVILYANERLEKLLGIPLQDLMGSNFNRLIKDDEIENFKKTVHSKTEPIFTRELNFERPDKKILTLNLSISWLPENSFGELCIIIIDLTNRKKNELELIESLQLLEKKKAELIITNQNLLFANRAAVKYSANEIISNDLLAKSKVTLLEEISHRSNTQIKFTNSQELIDQILLASEEDIKLLNVEGDIIMISEGFRKLMGINDLSGMVNNPWINLWKGVENGKAMNALAEARNGKTAKFEGFRSTKNGIPKWWEVTITPVRDENQKVYSFLIISHDITQIKEYQETITKSKNNLHALLENSIEGFLLLDNNYTILAFNQLMEKLIFQTEHIKLIKNKNLLHELSPEKQPKFREIFKNVKNGEKINFEKYYPLSDDGGIFMEIRFYPLSNQDSSITGIGIRMEDISKKKITALKAIEEKEFTDTIINHSHSPILIWDKKFTIIRINDAFKRMTGLNETTLIGKPVNEILPSLKDEIAFKKNESRINNNEKIESVIQNTDKTSRTVIWTISKIIDQQTNQPNYGIAQGQDVTEKQQFVLALNESESIYKNLFENMINGFAYCKLVFEGEKPVDFSYLSINKNFEIITGLKNVIGKKISEVIPGIHRDDPTLLEIVSRVAIKGKPEKFEIFLSSMQEWFLVSVYSPNTNYFVLVFEMITKEKKAEAELKESENRLNLILENNITGVWEFNAKKEYIFQNKMHDTIFGNENNRHKFNLDSFITHVINEDKNWVNKLLTDSISTKKGFEFECRIRRSDGMIRWVFIKGIPRLNAGGDLNSVLGIIEDISDRKSNENAIAKIENNLRAIFENAQAGYLLLDNNFIVLEFNNLMGQYFEITEKILLKKNENILTDLSKEGQDAFSKMIKAVYNGENLNFEISRLLLDGTTINLYSKLYPITNKDNKVTGACLYYEDITARKKTERNIQELNNSLDKKVFERTEQYEILNKELEAFTFSVSHDLRAPLRAVIGYAEILEEEQIKVLNDEGKKMLSNIKHNGQKMGRLIDDLLAFSRLGRKEINKSWLKMNELTTAAVEELNNLLPNHAEITIGPLPEAEGDYNLIYQVMFNLIGNAIKYSAKKEKPIISIYSEQKEGKTLYIIKDNGAGFDMRFAEKLFGVFQRLHSEQEFEGNGVGLAIVQRIIHKHGGIIWGEGKENEGANFYFTLN